MDAFKEAKISGIDHPLLNQPANIIMNVTVSRGNVFDDVYIEDDEGQRYYYHERDEQTNPKGEKHADRAHYLQANFKIGSATQISNGVGMFKSKTIGQGTNDYYKRAHRELHAAEQKLFRDAMQHIQNGEVLSAEEKQVLQSGTYYRYNSPVKFRTFKPDQQNFNPDYQITHIGHAAEYISLQNNIPLQICIDPVHYQTGTGGTAGLIGMGGKILYDRYTDPAFGTDGYPGVNIVLISHNHFDHMCESSIREAFGQTNTLFIIPAGDAKHLEAFGLTNYIEMGSWNDILTISLQDSKGFQSDYEIRSFPANHASCRGPSDFFESLYMGYTIRDLSTNKLILCSGDTAVLKPQHFRQFESYLVENELTVSAACIAHGPDRPRSWMECSHQSTADAITMHAEFNMMNARSYARKNNTTLDELPFEEFKNSACHAIGYHQGCYRLGLLSLSDADSTILRTLAVLASFGDTPVQNITPEELSKNVFFNFMDKFEQIALVSTLGVYMEKGYLKNKGFLTAKHILELETTHLNLPQPGYRSDFGKASPYKGFEFDYNRLLINRNPCQKKPGGMNEGALEYFCALVKPDAYMDVNPAGLHSLIHKVLACVIDRKRNLAVSDFLLSEYVNFDRNLSIEERLSASIQKLGELYKALFPQQDEGIRNESHTHTAITMLAGLLYFPDFRQKMCDRHNKLHGIVSIKDVDIQVSSFEDGPK